MNKEYENISFFLSACSDYGIDKNDLFQVKASMIMVLMDRVIGYALSRWIILTYPTNVNKLSSRSSLTYLLSLQYRQDNLQF